MGPEGASVGYGNTVPLAGQIPAAFLGETITSFLLVAGIFFFSGHRKLRRFTPFLMPPLYCIMVFAEGALSGTSTNPGQKPRTRRCQRRTWTAWWLYWLAPLAGAALAVWFFRLPVLKWWEVLPKVRHRGKPAAKLHIPARPPL